MAAEGRAKTFGTFEGVFLPSALTIFGVIMYLRMGWVVGNVGLVQTLLIVSMASTITLITALAISATATNMKVAGGGAYYMISRSLGLEFGAAVGLPLYLAQALGISFYLVGFAESVNALWTHAPIPVVAVAALVFTFGVAFKSAHVAIKSQFLLFLIIAASLVAFFMGSSLPPETAASLRVEEVDVTFWVAFAVFFPAVTGILSGVSMSGDLTDAAKSLPIGTVAAVLTGYVIYMLIPIVLTQFVDDPAVLKSSMVMQKLSLYEPLIVAGIWGATLSSALGSLLGAPRTLQALARDGVLSKPLRFLGKGSGKNQEPRIATFVTLILALGGILAGDLNALAPVLSMFFLTAYGVLNLSAGIEGMIANPAWRPKFRTPWPLCLLGAFLCFATMFMIDAGSTILAMIVSVAVYWYMQRKNLRSNFGDMRRGILMFLARYSIFKLAGLVENAKSWRPNVLVFSGSPTSRWYLIELAHDITHGKGFLTISTILQQGSQAENRLQQMRTTIAEYLRKRDVLALVNVSVADDVTTGVTALVRTYGLGPLVPNTIMLGETKVEDNYLSFARMVIRIYQEKRNIVIVRKGVEVDRPANDQKSVVVWWGRERENAGLSLALGYMLQNSPKWSGAELHLKSVTTKAEEKDSARDLLVDFLAESRVEAKADVYLAPPEKQKIFATIREQSESSDLIFIGMEPPDLARFIENEESYIEEYAGYYRRLLKLTDKFPKTAIVLSAEDVKFTEIFQ